MKYIILFLLLLFIAPAFSQDETPVADIFWDAESFFYEKDYVEALTLYLEIYNREYNQNSNINYRIGVCYLKGFNRHSDKVKAIPYMERAVKSTTKNYKEGDFSLESAHEDAYIYLGDAYLINNELDHAIMAYNDYKEISGTTDEYYLNIVNRKIETCNSAKILESLDVKYEIKNLGNVINNNYANYNASISADGKLLVYTSNMLFYEAVMYSERKSNGEFAEPGNLNIDARVEGSIRSLCVSPDGNEIYVFKPGLLEGTGNIYVSIKTDGKWSELSKLNINSGSLDRDASISPDGKTLYFTSNRVGGYGGLDIYKSEKDANGHWGKAINLGSTINTRFDEITPFVLADNRTLYFSSQGHAYNIGGADIFMTKCDEAGNYSEPLNFGYPMNTTDDDYFLFPLGSEGKALIHLGLDEGYGDLDIYEVTFFPKEKPAVLLVGQLDNKEKKITMDISANGTDMEGIKTKKDGKVSVEVPSGEIRVRFTADDMDAAVKEIKVPMVYCLAEVDVSDVKLKHNEKVVEKTNDQNVVENQDSNNNGSTKSKAEATAIEAILFGFNQSVPQEYKASLDRLAEYMKSSDNIQLEVQGYADLQGDEEYNMYLSKKRAEFVKEYLVSKGVEEKKLVVKAYGEQNQISKDLTPESRKYNRRVTFKVIRDDVGKLTVNPPVIPDKYRI
ncbi:MAG: OmpA family protein [Bacteroidota bacterium]